MPYVNIAILKRGLKEKRALAKAVTEAIAKTLEISYDRVHIVISEMSKEQNAIAGELLCDRLKKADKKKKR